MLILSEADVINVLTMTSGIEVCEKAYAAYSEGRIRHFSQAGDPLGDEGGAYIILPAAHQGKEYFGFKYAGSYPSNPAKGIPTVACTIQLCDLTTGFPVCLMGANHLTSIKTASSQSMAIKYMSRKNAEIMGIIGAGHQASFQLLGASLVRTLKEVRIADSNIGRAETLARWYEENISDKATVFATSQLSEAIRGADIVTTITTSFTPVIEADDIASGAHVNAMGSFNPQMQEIGGSVVQRAARIATDVAETTWRTAGDLIKAVEQGWIKENIRLAALGDIVAGKESGREKENEVTLFESVGFSVLDIALAIGVYEEAKEKKIGCNVNMFQNGTNV